LSLQHLDPEALGLQSQLSGEVVAAACPPNAARSITSVSTPSRAM
jgi:hypothetical protein